MVRFNFWDKFFGLHPKTFKKTAEKQIIDNTLNYMKVFGRARWISTEEIFQKTLEQTDFFNSDNGKMFFAIQGIKSKIHSATSKLRRDGYPIIAGTGLKGYRYADENCRDFIHIWTEKFGAWEKRKSDLVKEAKNDEQLIKKIIERLKQTKREKEAQKLEEVLIKYRRKAKQVEES